MNSFADKILEANSELLEALRLLFEQKTRQASADTKGGKFAEDACRIATTIANINRDAYAVEAQTQAQEKLAVTSLLRAMSTGQTEGVEASPGPLTPERLAQLRKRTSGAAVGRKVEPTTGPREGMPREEPDADK